MKITIRLRPERDDDIKDWYEALPRGDRSRIIRRILKEYLDSCRDNDLVINKGKSVINRKQRVLQLKTNECKRDYEDDIDNKLDSLLDQI